MKVGYIFLVLVCRHVDGVDSGAPRNMEGRSVVRVKWRNTLKRWETSSEIYLYIFIISAFEILIDSTTFCIHDFLKCLSYCHLLDHCTISWNETSQYFRVSMFSSNPDSQTAHSFTSFCDAGKTIWVFTSGICCIEQVQAVCVCVCASQVLSCESDTKTESPQVAPLIRGGVVDLTIRVM